MTIDIVEEVTNESDEVLYASSLCVAIDNKIIERLGSLAVKTNRGRLRLCAHQTPNDDTHEMFIVHPRGAYVPPHKHLGKSESLLILSGTCEHVLFDDQGRITAKRRMGDLASGHDFYLRIGSPIFHSLVILSDQLVFLEITKGPFQRQDTFIAPWAPKAGSDQAIEYFFSDIRLWGDSCGS